MIEDDPWGGLDEDEWSDALWKSDQLSIPDEPDETEPFLYQLPRKPWPIYSEATHVLTEPLPDIAHYQEQP